MFDAAVMGAGPAGTAAAFVLLEKGLKVLLLDKYEFPRKKACAGGLTPKGLHLFPYDISPVIKRECRTIKITPPGAPSFHIQDQNILCHMTRREELDLFSLERVMEKGAQFKIIKRIHSICEKAHFVEIDTGSDCFKASYLIGADGANSIVRRFAAKGRFWQKQTAIEADVKLDRPENNPMEFDFSRLKNGYFWIFPKDDHVNIGIYSYGSRAGLQTRQLLEYAGKKLSSHRLDSVKGYPICTGGVHYRPESSRILLCGDAAGFAEPLLGEGIYFAVKSGQDAAFSILEAEAGHVSAKFHYMKKLKEIQTDLRLYRAGAGFLYRFPRVSLKLLSFPYIHDPFARGYAQGKPLNRILTGNMFGKNNP
ncbi:MAG: geranylgeranyl reductase family protein [Desulfobacteraceae bacterium]|nr:geranylgeranyl reductase family protein [Desulfobacteraceae bacterium]